jgi:hypothetical protein
MRPNPNDLPAALRSVASEPGLEYLPFLPAGVVPFPVACAALPVFKDPLEIERLPIQMNFRAVTLDLDCKEGRDEYERTMTYLASGYGMRLVHIERTLVIKTVRAKSGDKRMKKKIRRVYLEYYAPYRVLTGSVGKE